MSIFAGFGATPSNFTVPPTVAAVAGSIGAAGVVAGGLEAVGCSSAGSFLLHPASGKMPTRASNTEIVICVFFFILFHLFECLKAHMNRTLLLSALTCVAGRFHARRRGDVRHSHPSQRCSCPLLLLRGKLEDVID